MRPDPVVRPRPARRLLALTAALAATVAGLALLSSSTAAADQPIPVPATGTITVNGHGNGHGHGLSQYGSQGAALRGLNARAILAFYYRNTSLDWIGATDIRVGLSGAGWTTVTHATALRSTAGTIGLNWWGVYRLVPSGGGLRVQWRGGAGWNSFGPALPAQADFATTLPAVQVYLGDGTSADYRGTVGAVRTSSGEATVNRLPLDSYVQGVVPRESPSYWQPAALQAQAVAARSYARYEVTHAGAAPYDICDTTQCQVYGGLARYDAAGNRMYGEENSSNAAVAATANEVLTYRGSVIFSQFSASDGGWTADGGQPYLLAQPDPYDDTASGDPYLSWSRTVSVAGIANYVGLRSVDQIQITRRDGNGEWGGRVQAGYVVGTDYRGVRQWVALSGYELQSAMQLPHHWFSIQPPPPPPPAVAPQSGPGTTNLPVSSGTAGPATVSATPNSAQMFFINSAGSMQEREYVYPYGWQAPTDLGAPAGRLTLGPAAATWGGGHIDLAGRDGSGHLVLRTYAPGSGWGGWRTYPWVMDSTPAAVSPWPGALDIFFRAADDTLWTAGWRSGAGWSTATQVPGVTGVISGPAATTSSATRAVTVVYRAAGNTLRMVTRSWAGAWGAPVAVNPTHALPAAPAAVDPAATDTGHGGTSVYYTGTNKVLYHASYDPAAGAWSAWFSVPGSAGAVSAPAVSNEGPGQVNVLAGYGNRVWATAWNWRWSWRSWYPLN